MLEGSSHSGWICEGLIRQLGPHLVNQKPPNVGAGACEIWGHREEAQRPLHETMCLAEARLERHAPGGSMPSEAPKHCKIQSRMAILEAPCAQNAPGRSTMRPPEALLPRNPTWGSPHFSGLTIKSQATWHTYALARTKLQKRWRPVQSAERCGCRSRGCFSVSEADVPPECRSACPCADCPVSSLSLSDIPLP